MRNVFGLTQFVRNVIIDYSIIDTRVITREMSEKKHKNYRLGRFIKHIKTFRSDLKLNYPEDEQCEGESQYSYNAGDICLTALACLTCFQQNWLYRVTCYSKIKYSEYRAIETKYPKIALAPMYYRQLYFNERKVMEVLESEAIFRTDRATIIDLLDRFYVEKDMEKYFPLCEGRWTEEDNIRLKKDRENIFNFLLSDGLDELIKYAIEEKALLPDTKENSNI